MSTRYRRYKAFDARTGRLERAVNLIEDGEIRGIYTSRREADDKHPLSKPFRVGADRATLITKMHGERKKEDTGLEIVVGYAAGANLYEGRPGMPTISVGTPGATATIDGVEVKV